MVSGKCNLVSQSYILSSQWEGLQSLSQDVLTTCQGCKSLCLIKHHARIDWHPSSCLAEMGNYPFLPMRMDRYEYDRMYLLQKHRPSQQSTPGKSFPGPSWNGSPSHLSGDHQNITSSMKETLELNRSPSSSFKHLKKSKLILIFKMLRSLLPEAFLFETIILPKKMCSCHDTENADTAVSPVHKLTCSSATQPKT
ncbi:uncharacterized protein LOC120300205 isoform X3 [Crotalus tigris]|uniref:uncharacterized protein LOC120300205 isoform X3 n=1 Tax=Crotalus tigris TaxID=88082 RepID=UPI00192F95B1|nr:uncharacterized protein LOC120300205 isoform X3 [Crotalus tigris]